MPVQIDTSIWELSQEEVTASAHHKPQVCAVGDHLPHHQPPMCAVGVDVLPEVMKVKESPEPTQKILSRSWMVKHSWIGSILQNKPAVQ